MKRDVVILNEGTTLRAVLPCDIDHHRAKIIRREIDGAMERNMPQRLVLDFSEVSFMDSSGIGLIIGRTEQARKCGATVEILGASDELMRLMRICGIERIKDLYILH